MARNLSLRNVALPRLPQTGLNGTDMEHVDYVVVGAGISGLSFANAILEEAKRQNKPEPSVAILEADNEPGGYCKTIQQDGFVWDYSGHFFHFKHPEIEKWLIDRIASDQEIRSVQKKTYIRFDGHDIDFPFQKNIHQLPKADFIDCLVDLYFRDESANVSAEQGALPRSFQDMLYRRFGKGIAERFLIPYNEKLYATDLDQLDSEAMGRFFPHADIDDIIRNMRQADNASYNSNFTYPRGGAIQYINALLKDLPPTLLHFEERLLSVDLAERIATTEKQELHFDRLVCSAPFPQLAKMCGLPIANDAFTWNKVLCFNLGFDAKGPENVHWMYFPDRDTRFYRVGFYDNIMGDSRMSLYVEIGAHKDQSFDVDVERERVLADLRKEKIIDGQQLVSHHHVVMNPAYVHITKDSLREHARAKSALEAAGVYPVGRYGAWTYCSIEDNIVETRALAKRFSPSLRNG